MDEIKIDLKSEIVKMCADSYDRGFIDGRETIELALIKVSELPESKHISIKDIIKMISQL